MSLRATTLVSDNLELRRAGPDDYDGLVALQRRSYSRNRELLGVEPLPLQADYHAVLAAKEVWVAEGRSGLAAALVVEPRDDDLLIESLAVDPAAQNRGYGRALLRAAVARAKALGYTSVRLYTGSPLTHLISWYGRHGFKIERTEAMSDRSITHMVMTIA